MDTTQTVSNTRTITRFTLQSLTLVSGWQAAFAIDNDDPAGPPHKIVAGPIHALGVALMTQETRRDDGSPKGSLVRRLESTEVVALECSEGSFENCHEYHGFAGIVPPGADPAKCTDWLSGEFDVVNPRGQK